MVFGQTLLIDSLTYWETNGRNGFGVKLFEAPILILGRYIQNEKLDTISNEEDLKPTVTCYTDREVTVGSYIALGDFLLFTDPLNIATAYNIKQVIKRTGISSGDKIWKAIL